MVVVVTCPGDAVYDGPVYRGKLTDRSRLEKDLDRAIYRRPADRRQLFAKRLRCEALMLLLQGIDDRLPGKSEPIAAVLQCSRQTWGRCVKVHNDMLYHYNVNFALPSLFGSDTPYHYAIAFVNTGFVGS